MDVIDVSSLVEPVELVWSSRRVASAGCRWCRPRRRGRSWPGAARGGRGRGRWPRSRPRTAAGTRGRRGRPGSAAGTAARRRRRRRRRAGAATARTRRTPRRRRPGPAPRPGVSSGWAAVTDVVVALDERDAAAGELHDGVVAAGLGQVAERLDREVVVLLVEVLATGLGDREDLGRSAAAAGRRRARLARLERALGEQLVEVTAYGGRGQVEPLREVGRGRRTADQDRPDDALTRRLVARRQGPLEFHNTSVPLLPWALQVRVTLPGVPWPAGAPGSSLRDQPAVIPATDSPRTGGIAGGPSGSWVDQVRRGFRTTNQEENT